MSTELEGAFSELKDAKAEVTGGKREFVLLNGRKIEAVVSEIGIEDVFIAGGVPEGADFRISIAQSDLAEEPRKNDDIECRGQTGVILLVSDINGVTWDLTVGDPTRDQR